MRSKYLVSIKCDNFLCGKTFQKYKGEYNRSLKIGRKQYCSLKCYGEAEGQKHLEDIDPKIKKRWQNNIKKYCGNLRDIYSPFRYFIKCMKNRPDKWDNSINLKYLKKIWDKQEGVCPYTGWKMNLPVSSIGFAKRCVKNASVDRIDGSKGYTQDNIRFVSFIANVSRCDFADKDILKFCKSVVQYKKM